MLAMWVAAWCLGRSVGAAVAVHCGWGSHKELAAWQLVLAVRRSLTGPAQWRGRLYPAVPPCMGQAPVSCQGQYWVAMLNLLPAHIPPGCRGMEMVRALPAQGEEEVLQVSAVSAIAFQVLVCCTIFRQVGLGRAS